MKLSKADVADVRVMRMKQLTQYCSLSRALIYSLIQQGDFPVGYMLTSGSRCWEKSEVDAWLDERMGRAA